VGITSRGEKLPGYEGAVEDRRNVRRVLVGNLTKRPLGKKRSID
jgi:hypothetical protein